jgi:quercetin dioxygenase-like cupin family protein
MDWSRRELCVALPVLLASSYLTAEAQVAEGTVAEAQVDQRTEKTTLPSGIYQFDDLPVHQSGSLVARNILEGKIFEGCHISLHESDLAPNSAPHPPHRHRHEEMVFVVEGALEFTINGKATRAGEGSVLFAGSNDEHGIRNPESSHAKYFVLALGAE